MIQTFIKGTAIGLLLGAFAVAAGIGMFFGISRIFGLH